MMLNHNVISMLFNLFLVIFLLGGLVFILQKIKKSNFIKNKNINIVNVIHLGAKEKVVLIEVNQLKILLGVTSTHINPLYVFEEPLAKSQVQNNEIEKKDFSKIMAGIT